MTSRGQSLLGLREFVPRSFISGILFGAHIEQESGCRRLDRNPFDFVNELLALLENVRALNEFDFVSRFAFFEQLCKAESRFLELALEHPDLGFMLRHRLTDL